MFLLEKAESMLRKSLLSLPIMAASLAACAASTDAGPEVQGTQQALAGDANYIIVYKRTDTAWSAQADVTNAGGTLLSSYPYGVVVASSASPTFAAEMAAKWYVQSVAATGGLAVDALPQKIDYNKGLFLPPPPPAASNEELAPYQWNMNMIRAPQARAVTRGKRSVVVGVMDSGIDDSQPDLAGQVDYQRRRSACVAGGVADPPRQLEQRLDRTRHSRLRRDRRQG